MVQAEIPKQHHNWLDPDTVVSPGSWEAVLRATGAVVFLDVPVEQLRRRVHPASDRPLIHEEGDIERLLEQREPLYREFAAHVVDGSGRPGEVAAAIEEELRWSA